MWGTPSAQSIHVRVSEIMRSSLVLIPLTLALGCGGGEWRDRHAGRTIPLRLKRPPSFEAAHPHLLLEKVR